jgi:hypothetical protein
MKAGQKRQNVFREGSDGWSEMSGHPRRIKAVLENQNVSMGVSRSLLTA